MHMKVVNETKLRRITNMSYSKVRNKRSEDHYENVSCFFLSYHRWKKWMET